MAGLIGVFGGSFDPPHLGHLILADEGRTALQLERVLWVVTADPPHKPGGPSTPIQDRVEMVQLAIQQDPSFELSRLEIERPGPHYAVDTLRMLHEQAQGNLVYLMGGDSLRDLLSWREPENLVAMCKHIGVMERVGVELGLEKLTDQLPGLEQKVLFFQAPLIEISSSMIRERIAELGSYKYFLPPAVAEYIQSKRLYHD